MENAVNDLFQCENQVKEEKPVSKIDYKMAFYAAAAFLAGGAAVFGFIDAEVSLITDLTKNFIASLMRGYDLNQGPELLISRFEACYFGSAKKAIETAIRMIFTKFEDIKDGKFLPETDYR